MAERYLSSRIKESVHYASTPTLFYDAKYYNSSSSSGDESNISRYKSTIYLDSSATSSEISDEPSTLTLSAQDIKRAESVLRGHKSRLYVCKCLANLYTCPKVNLGAQNSAIKWTLKFTGIPVLIHDLGNTKSRSKRQIQICLVEKGSGFVLWKDIVDHLSKYQVSSDLLFHTMHLSVDHSRMIGLSFDTGPEAREFYQWLSVLTSDPANISLNGPYRISPLQTNSYQEGKR